MNTQFLPRALLDGTLYSLVLGIAILASLYWNPRLWMQDLPQEIRKNVAPLSQREKRDRTLFAVPFMALTLGLPLWLVVQLKAQSGGALAFGEAYLYLLIVLQAFNLFDALVIDWVVLTVLQPRRFVIQGAEGMTHTLSDPMYHISNFLRGVVFCAVSALILAAVSLLF